MGKQLRQVFLFCVFTRVLISDLPYAPCPWGAECDKVRTDVPFFFTLLLQMFKIKLLALLDLLIPPAFAPYFSFWLHLEPPSPFPGPGPALANPPSQTSRLLRATRLLYINTQSTL